MYKATLKLMCVHRPSLHHDNDDDDEWQQQPM